MARFLSSDSSAHREQVTIELDGQEVQVPAGQSVAAVMLSLGLPWTRRSPVTGAARAPLCLMGVCFECLMEIDGMPNRQACMIQVTAGMRVRRQLGPGDG